MAETGMQSERPQSKQEAWVLQRGQPKGGPMAAGSLTYSPEAGRSLEHSKGWAMGRQKKRRTRCWVFQGTHGGGGGGRWVACVCFQVKRSGLAGQVGCPIRA